MCSWVFIAQHRMTRNLNKVLRMSRPSNNVRALHRFQKQNIGLSGFLKPGHNVYMSKHSFLTKWCWSLFDCPLHVWKHKLLSRQRASPGWGYSGWHPWSSMPLQLLWLIEREGLGGGGHGLFMYVHQSICEHVSTYKRADRLRMVLVSQGVLCLPTYDCIKGEGTLSEDFFVARHCRALLASFPVQIS